MSENVAGYKAVARLYNALMTGLVLALLRDRGAQDARRFVLAHFPPPASGEVSSRPCEARPRPPAGRGRLRAVPLFLQRAGRREDRIRRGIGKEGMGALSAAALDLAGHRDLRHPARG